MKQYNSGKLNIFAKNKPKEYKYFLYISDFFENYRQSYYDSLDMVRRKNDLEQWILFFLEGVLETAKKSKQTFENILKLKEI